MANLTSKELTALEDQLGVEQMLIRKYSTMANETNDQTLKSKFTAISNKHQCHFDQMKTYLQ